MAIKFSCSCGKGLEVSEEFAGQRVRCPFCGAIVLAPQLPGRGAIRIDKADLPAASSNEARSRDTGSVSSKGGSSLRETMRANQRITGKTCSICQSEIKLGETVRNCPHCKLPFHLSCWEENSGCGTYGCESAPSAPPIRRTDAEISVRLDQLPDYRTPVPPVGQPSYAPQYTTGAGKTSGMATASFILALVGICVGFLGILAVIFGAIALGEISREPRLQGHGLAVAGIVIGILEIAAMVAVLASVSK